jgi:hypothetical protein
VSWSFLLSSSRLFAFVFFTPNRPLKRYVIVPAWINADAQTRLGDEISAEVTGSDGVAGDDGIAHVEQRWMATLAHGGYRGSTRVARNMLADGLLIFVRWCCCCCCC